MTSKNKVTAFAPASSANLAVGFDLLGLSLDFAGDEVTVERTPHHVGVVLNSATGVEVNLPQNPKCNSATAGLVQLIVDKNLDFGFSVSIKKGIPMGSGMGGSAASAVASIVAANEFLEVKLSPAELLHYALLGEFVATGAAHADNIAPSLFGGMTLAQVETPPTQSSQKQSSQTPSSQTSTASPQVASVMTPVHVVKLPLPQGLHLVLIHPHLQIKTKDARQVLNSHVSLQDFVTQSAHLARFISACYTDNLKEFKNSLQDFIIEPQRQHLIPGFQQVKKAALEAGALGCSISGSGPSVFAFAASEYEAKRILFAMSHVFQENKLQIDSWIQKLPCVGARIIR